MIAYLVRRLIVAAGAILGVVTLVFLSLHFTPGDPVEMLIPAEATGSAGKALVQQIRVRYGFDRPLYAQYALYLRRLAALDLGASIRTGRPVAVDLRQRYPATFVLAVTSLFIAAAIGIPVGVVSALRPNSVTDTVIMTAALIGVSIPSFWSGLLLMLLFSLKLGWLPASGWTVGLWSWDSLRHLIMPAVTLGIEPAGILARLVRSAMLDVLREDYIRTARAKGLTGRAVVYRHALRNAFIPVITVLGLLFGGLLAGAVIVETVFAWPGIGRYIVFGITGKDFPVVQGGVLFIALVFVIANLLVDLLYALLDPRISYA